MLGLHFICESSAVTGAGKSAPRVLHPGVPGCFKAIEISKGQNALMLSRYSLELYPTVDSEFERHRAGRRHTRRESHP